MQLKEILRDLPGARVTGDPETSIQGLAYDSRAVERGYLFAALRGEARDGLDFLDQALERGAVAVLASRPSRGRVAWVQAEDDRRALALMARAYYGRPDERLMTVGVTGTNGKTTVCYLLEAALREADLKPCLLGTVAYRYGRDESRAERTTPESLDLYRHLDRFASSGARSCAMEVSSHALAQQRVAGIAFRAGVFTNLTQDHLDFHRTMERYREAKAGLFRDLPERAVAVLNADDEASAAMRAATRARVVTFGESTGADLRLASHRPTAGGSEVTLAIGPGVAPGASLPGTLTIASPLIGVLNARNLAAAAAASLALGLPVEAVARGLGQMRGVPGRLERVDDDGEFLVLVDYAHTDDALSQVLSAVRELRPRRVITVFGCGGDRDRAKRPRMGFAAAQASDLVIVTSDNPRSEDPQAIIDGILPGVRKALGGSESAPLPEERCLVVLDRREAIRRAVERARKGDCVVIAGKGHEPYQILADKTIPFDDRQVARDALAGLRRGKAV
ncbi:MAG TPA: UDP-N-acetylmuramoyl-L-alanyl-D-glutamate--2,6-diaminopimelate ligase [Candidatus Cryosericum sp.]|nr:UDP-N-acetylmuramoyl-L-alanyl-D-glutamate--2,6-diaminopimelate ligase [Candidatus Cryosericum sp.]